MLKNDIKELFYEGKSTKEVTDYVTAVIKSVKNEYDKELEEAAAASKKAEQKKKDLEEIKKLLSEYKKNYYNDDTFFTLRW